MAVVHAIAYWSRSTTLSLHLCQADILGVYTHLLQNSKSTTFREEFRIIIFTKKEKKIGIRIRYYEKYTWRGAKPDMKVSIWNSLKNIYLYIIIGIPTTCLHYILSTRFVDIIIITGDGCDRITVFRMTALVEYTFVYTKEFIGVKCDLLPQTVKEMIWFFAFY